MGKGRAGILFFRHEGWLARARRVSGGYANAQMLDEASRTWIDVPTADVIFYGTPLTIEEARETCRLRRLSESVLYEGL